MTLCKIHMRELAEELTSLFIVPLGGNSSVAVVGRNETLAVDSNHAAKCLVSSASRFRLNPFHPLVSIEAAYHLAIRLILRVRRYANIATGIIKTVPIPMVNKYLRIKKINNEPMHGNLFVLIVDQHRGNSVVNQAAILPRYLSSRPSMLHDPLIISRIDDGNHAPRKGYVADRSIVRLLDFRSFVQAIHAGLRASGHTVSALTTAVPFSFLRRSRFQGFACHGASSLQRLLSFYLFELAKKTKIRGRIPA